MIEKIKKFKEIYWLFSLVVAFFIGLITILWSVFNQYESILDKYEDLVSTQKTTQQMALKSVIWNEDIPLGERASACDVYLNAGYNSLTKKECEVIIEEGIKQGLFSNIKRE